VFSLIYRSLEENETFFWKSGLKEQKEEKQESEEVIERRRRVIDRTSVQAFKARIECTCVRVRRRRSTVVRLNAPRAIERTCA
jgi:hypothetical protein